MRHLKVHFYRQVPSIVVRMCVCACVCARVCACVCVRKFSNYRCMRRAMPQSQPQLTSFCHWSDAEKARPDDNEMQKKKNKEQSNWEKKQIYHACEWVGCICTQSRWDLPATLPGRVWSVKLYSRITHAHKQTLVHVCVCVCVHDVCRDLVFARFKKKKEKQNNFSKFSQRVVPVVVVLKIVFSCFLLCFLCCFFFGVFACALCSKSNFLNIS